MCGDGRCYVGYEFVVGSGYEVTDGIPERIVHHAVKRIAAEVFLAFAVSNLIRCVLPYLSEYISVPVDRFRRRGYSFEEAFGIFVNDVEPPAVNAHFHVFRDHGIAYIGAEAVALNYLGKVFDSPPAFIAAVG